MLVIAGLGNPGSQYALTRHNAGFNTIDYLTEELKATMPKEKFDGLIFTAKVKNRKVLLVKPQTYMNESGRCLQAIMQFYKLKPENFVVIYDDIDLPEGKIRVRAKGGAGTHNGMRSILSCFGSENFARIRVGIGQPPHKDMDLADYVLGKFSKESCEKMKDAFARAKDAAVELAKNGVEASMQKYNSME
ncbi:MAG: aminoacyl-tRNA hydrolase [Clostridia bacterium]|nr:aminoacyl-tRNA hydrolase [Clostridia bacterium]